jgi:thioredoxin 1
MAILNLTDDNFNEVISSNGTVLVDFFAVWCGPCKMMSPVIDEIAAENPDITVGKCDVDEAGDTAGEFGIMSIPTIMVFKNGEIAKTFIGVTSKQDIVDALR